MPPRRWLRSTRSGTHICFEGEIMRYLQQKPSVAPRIIVSRHAKQRMRKRFHWPIKSGGRMAARAWEKGARIERTCDHRLLMFLNQKTELEPQAEVRIHGDLVYIFGRKHDDCHESFYFLITVFSLPQAIRLALRGRKQLRDKYSMPLAC